MVLEWQERLPAEQKHLWVGIKPGHKTSMGVNAFHFPQGNALFDRPPAEDPLGRLDHHDPVSRGLATLGHAALAAPGIRTNGTPTGRASGRAIRSCGPSPSWFRPGTAERRKGPGREPDPLRGTP